MYAVHLKCLSGNPEDLEPHREQQKTVGLLQLLCPLLTYHNCEKDEDCFTHAYCALQNNGNGMCFTNQGELISDDFIYYLPTFGGLIFLLDEW